MNYKLKHVAHEAGCVRMCQPQSQWEASTLYRSCSGEVNLTVTESPENDQNESGEEWPCTACKMCTVNML